MGADEETITSLEVSALVVLRIAKHCHDNLPDYVTGPLLGLDEPPILYATDCFGFPQKLGDHDEEGAEGSKYQSEMLRSLREVNVDCNIIGWYQSTYMGSFMNETLVDAQYAFQTEIPKSVVLIYDPLQTSVGKGAFRAFRLRSEFMKKYTESKAGEGTVASIKSADIFQEVPLKIVNPVLVEAFLLEQERKQQGDGFEALDLENQTFLEKNITFLLDSLDCLSAEQQKMQYFERMAVRAAQQKKTIEERRRQENAQRRERGEELVAETDTAATKRQPQPSQVETLLISSQISTYCNQINTFAGDAFGKVFLVGGSA